MKPLAFQYLLLMLLLTSCAEELGPNFSLSTPSQFSSSVRKKTFHAGAPLSEFLPTNYAPFEMTLLYGRWIDPSFINYTSTGTYYGQTKYRDWWVEVQRGVTPKTKHGIQVAQDGYDADLGDEADASARIYPRFQHKHFPWGEAVSFLVQYQNDTSNFAPCNGMLLYEVHGISSDGKYTIVAQFGVTHPKLTDFGNLNGKIGDYRDDTYKPDSAIRRDHDYILVEHCPDSEFQPGLNDIDAMLSTIKIVP